MTKKDSKPQYTVSKWTERDGTEHDNYECVKCQFATLYKEKMDKHIATAVRDGNNPGHGHAWAHPNAQPQPEEPGKSELKY